MAEALVSVWVSETRSVGDAMAIQHRLRVGADFHLGCAVGITPDGEIRGLNHAERGFAGNNLQQASLAAKRAARLAARPGPVPASCSSVAGEKLRRVLRAFGPGAVVRCAQSQRCQCRSACRGEVSGFMSRAARTTSATFMPPNPRQRTRAMSLRGDCGPADTGNGQDLRIGRLQRGDAGQHAFAQGVQRQHEIKHAGRGDQMAEGPLESGDGRQIVCQRRGGGPGPRTHPKRGVPLPCATIMPTASAGIPASASASWMARLKPSPSGAHFEHAGGLR